MDKNKELLRAAERTLTEWSSASWWLNSKLKCTDKKALSVKEVQKCRYSLLESKSRLKDLADAQKRLEKLIGVVGGATGKTKTPFQIAIYVWSMCKEALAKLSKDYAKHESTLKSLEKKLAKTSKGGGAMTGKAEKDARDELEKLGKLVGKACKRNETECKKAAAAVKKLAKELKK